MELPISMLACARIGAVHSVMGIWHEVLLLLVIKTEKSWSPNGQVVFAGFSAESLAQRIVDCKPKAVLTCNAVRRGSKVINLKDIVDAALVEAEKEETYVSKWFCAGSYNLKPLVYMLFMYILNPYK